MTPLWNFMVKNQNPWIFHFFNIYPPGIFTCSFLNRYPWIGNSMSSPPSPPPSHVACLDFFWISPMMGEWVSEWVEVLGWRQNVMSKTAIFYRDRSKATLVLKWIFSWMYLICRSFWFWFIPTVITQYYIMFGTIAIQ